MLSELDPASRQDIELSYKDYSNNQGPNRFQGRINPPRASNKEHACGVDLGNAYLIMDTSGRRAGPEEDLDYVVREYTDANRGAWLGTYVGLSPEDLAKRPDYVNWGLGWVTICFDSL